MRPSRSIRSFPDLRPAAGVALAVALAFALWPDALAAQATPAAPAAPASDAALPRLTLAAAVEQALDRYPALAAARAQVAQARAIEGEARAAAGPIARLLGVGQENKEKTLVSPIHGFAPGQFPPFDRTLVQASLTANYTLWDSGARRARVRQAGEQRAGLDAALAGLAQTVTARVTAAYAGILAKQQVFAAQRGRSDALGKELERVAKLLDAGRAPEVEKLRAEAALATAEAEATRGLVTLDGAERDLARLLGVEVEATRAARLDALSPLAVPAPLDERTALAARAVEASPQVELARRQVAAAKAGHALARSAYFPELKATGALQEFGSTDLDFQTEWNVGLQLSVPLWDGGATAQRVARATAVIDDAAARLRQAELDAREAVDRALAARDEAAARSTALGRAVDRLVEVTRIQKLLLEVGSGTQIDYLAAEAELATSRASLAEARTAELVARVELARAAGDLTPEWLQENLSESAAIADSGHRTESESEP